MKRPDTWSQRRRRQDNFMGYLLVTTAVVLFTLMLAACVKIDANHGISAYNGGL